VPFFSNGMTLLPAWTSPGGDERSDHGLTGRDGGRGLFR
jgi:hypothetical protein